MTKYDELLDMVVERTLNSIGHPDLNRFKAVVNNIKNNTKELKRSIKEKDKDKCLKMISSIESDIDEIKSIGENIDPEEYPDDEEESRIKFVRVACTVIGLLIGIGHLFDAYDDDMTYPTVATTIGAVLSYDIVTVSDAKKEISRAVRIANKKLDKLKNKCKYEGFLDDKNDKKTIKESVDEVKLEVYESCHYGEITEEERDILLSLI